MDSDNEYDAVATKVTDFETFQTRNIEHSDDEDDDHVSSNFEQKAGELSQGLSHRQKKDKRGSNLANALVGPAVALEHHMVQDKLSHELQKNHNHDASMKRNSNLSSLLVGPTHELEKRMTVDKLSHALNEDRTSGLRMTEMQTGVSAKLHSTMHELEKNKIKDTVHHLVEKRNSGGFRLPARSDLLAAPAKELEKNMHSNQVSKGLSRRSSQTEMVERGILLQPEVSQVLCAPVKELEKAMNRDQVNHKLDIAHRAQKYLDEANPGGKSPTKIGLQERMNAYKMAAAEKSVSTKKPVDAAGLGVKDRLAQYQTTATTKSPPKEVEVKTGLSMMERMQQYSQSASTSNVKKQIDLETLPSKQ